MPPHQYKQPVQHTPMQHPSDMDSSPIPSPAFTNVTQSTAASSNNCIRSNLKHRLDDVKNVFLSRGSSFKVQRGLFLAFIRSYERAQNDMQDYARLIANLLIQNPHPDARELAMKLADTFEPIEADFKAYMTRARLAIDMFSRLSFFEHQFNEKISELEGLQHEIRKSIDANVKRELMEQANQMEHDLQLFQTNFCIRTGQVFDEILYGVGSNICAHILIVQTAAESLKKSLYAFPGIENYVALDGNPS